MTLLMLHHPELQTLIDQLSFSFYGVIGVRAELKILFQYDESALPLPFMKF